MTGFASPTLRLNADQHARIVAHCLIGLPDEACGMLAGPVADPGAPRIEPTGEVTEVYPCANADASARTYTVESRDLLQAMRDAEAKGVELVGVWHSHTHTDAYPSDTDVRQAVEPGWLYVLVSLKHAEPIVRAYRIRDGATEEVDVVVA